MLLLLVSTNAWAQRTERPDPVSATPLFESAEEARANLSVTAREKLQRVEQLKTTVQTRLVRLAGTLPLHRRPVLAIHTGQGQPIIAERERIEITGENEYVWYGKPKHTYGDIILVVNNDEVTGTVLVEGSSYQIRSLGGGLHTITEADPNLVPWVDDTPQRIGNTGGNKALPEQAPFNPFLNPPLIENNNPVCMPSTIRVLAVYTADAAQSVSNINSVITLGISEANQAYQNSLIYSHLRMELAHAQQVSFQETPGNGNQMYADSSSIRTNSQVNTLRNQYNADVVILLTDDVYADFYGTFYGVAYEILASESQAYALVAAPYANVPQGTFAHEVGHLQGAQHDPDSPTDPNKDLGDNYGRVIFKDWFWQSRHHTVMAYPNSSHLVLNYSNPSVSCCSGRSTGSSTQNNARVLLEQAATVAAFRDPYATQATINTSNVSTNYTFTANACGGNGNYSYEWRVSEGDPFSYGGVVGTQQTFNYTVTAENTYFHLTINTTGGQTATAYTYIYNSQACTGPGCLGEGGDAEVEALPQQYALYAAYPNPFNSETTIRFDLPEAHQVTLAVYDVLGREVARLVDGEREAGLHTAQFKTGQLPNGVYLYRLTAGSYSATGQVTLMK